MYRKRSGIQLAYPFSPERLLNQGQFHFLWSPPYLLQPKLNGERARLIVEEGRALLLSSTEEIIPSVPHINASALRLPAGEYDGELYTHGMSWSEIHSVVGRTINLHPEYEKMQLHLFDTIGPASQAERLWVLSQALGASPPPYIKQVPTHIVDTLDEIIQLYDEFITSGYEGFIIRHIDAPYSPSRRPWMMKFKGKKKDDYPIHAVYEAISEDGTPKNMLGAFECIDDMGTTFKVGAGHLTHIERKLIWEEYLNNPTSILQSRLEILYQTLSDKGKVPLFSRALKILRANVAN